MARIRSLDSRRAAADLGRQAEAYVRSWLEARGDRVLAANFRIRQGELDLVTESRRSVREPVELVFIEVRARLPNAQGRVRVDGIGSIGLLKRQRIRRAARVFLARYSGRATRLRFDVLDWDGQLFRWYENLQL